MRCVFCRSGSTNPGRATLTLERGPTVLVVRDVPAQVCDVCGEEYFDQATTTSLLKVLDDMVKTGVQLEVRAFAAA